MKTINILLLFLLLNGISSAQNGYVPKPTSGFPLVGGRTMDMMVTSRAIDVSGFNKIDGSPFLMEEYVQTFIKLKTGEKFSNVWTRFNTYNNELLLEQKEGQLLALQNVDSLAFSRKISKGNTIASFKTGFPPVEEKNEQTFYEVLYSGSSISFLKYYKTSLEKVKKMGMPDKDAFIVKQEYYIYKPSSRSMEKIKLNKKSVTQALGEYPGFKESADDLKTEQGVISLLQAIRL